MFSIFTLFHVKAFENLENLSCALLYQVWCINSEERLQQNKIFLFRKLLGESEFWRGKESRLKLPAPPKCHPPGFSHISQVFWLPVRQWLPPPHKSSEHQLTGSQLYSPLSLLPSKSCARCLEFCKPSVEKPFEITSIR